MQLHFVSNIMLYIQHVGKLESQLNVMFCEACAASLRETTTTTTLFVLHTNKVVVVVVVALSLCTDECYKTAEFYNKYTIGEKIYLAFNEKWGQAF